MLDYMAHDYEMEWEQQGNWLLLRRVSRAEDRANSIPGWASDPMGSPDPWQGKFGPHARLLERLAGLNVRQVVGIQQRLAGLGVPRSGPVRRERPGWSIVPSPTAVAWLGALSAVQRDDLCRTGELELRQFAPRLKAGLAELLSGDELPVLPFPSLPPEWSVKLSLDAGGVLGVVRAGSRLSRFRVTFPTAASQDPPRGENTAPMPAEGAARLEEADPDRRRVMLPRTLSANSLAELGL